MKNIFAKKKRQQKGYALLFTVVIVSAVAVLSAGLTNAVYKQMVLSSLAKDSQLAFYQADTASECALYADLVVNTVDHNPEYFTNTSDGQPWSCGTNSSVSNLTIKSIPETETGLIHYTIEPIPSIVSDGGPCFRIDVTKTLNTEDLLISKKDVVVKAKGYNICDTANPRTVEREIETRYNE